MELRVHKVCQTASGGSHVTIYEADIELVRGDVQVEVNGTDPENVSPMDKERVRDAIRKGAEHVLRPRGLGANIRVSRVVIHPIDFKPRTFERYTAEELGLLLNAGLGQ